MLRPMSDMTSKNTIMRNYNRKYYGQYAWMESKALHPSLSISQTFYSAQLGSV